MASDHELIQTLWSFYFVGDDSPQQVDSRIDMIRAILAFFREGGNGLLASVLVPMTSGMTF